MNTSNMIEIKNAILLSLYRKDSLDSKDSEFNDNIILLFEKNSLKPGSDPTQYHSYTQTYVTPNEYNIEPFLLAIQEICSELRLKVVQDIFNDYTPSKNDFLFINYECRLDENEQVDIAGFNPMSHPINQYLKHLPSTAGGVLLLNNIDSVPLQEKLFFYNLATKSSLQNYLIKDCLNNVCIGLTGDVGTFKNDTSHIIGPRIQMKKSSLLDEKQITPQTELSEKIAQIKANKF